MSKPYTRQHFVPRFYSKQWAGSDGNLFQHIYTHRADEIEIKSRGPSVLGVKERLWIFAAHAEHHARVSVERDFFAKTVDCKAASLMLRILSGDELSEDHDKSAWAAFIASLHFRNPIAIALNREVAAMALQGKTPQWLPRPTHAEYVEQLAAELLMARIRAMQETVMKRRWHVFRGGGEKAFLTSDVPLVFFDSITEYFKPAPLRAEQLMTLALPLSPDTAFVAAATASDFEHLLAIERNRGLDRHLNEQILASHMESVWSHDLGQASYIRKAMLSRGRRSTLEDFRKVAIAAGFEDVTSRIN